MLSAVAARKARLRQGSLSTPEQTKKKRKSPHKTPPIPARHLHSQPSAAAVISSAKKPRKNAPERDITTTVTEVSNSFTSKEDSDDDSNMSITLDDQDTSLIPNRHPPEPTQQERTKAWSPSRPILDSSDAASDVSEQNLSDFPQFFPHNRSLTNEESEMLSTYRPVHEQNMFRLSIEEGLVLGLSGPAVVLALSPSATVSFVGAYRLRVLRGSVSLLGTIIRPSHVLHRVFAPRSSPIPVIEAHEARGESSKLFSLPAQIMNTIDDRDVLIVLQELRTGIEGLGCVVRTFEGVFDQASTERTLDLPLEGVHLVTNTVRGMRAFQVPASWEAAFSAPLLSSTHEAASLSKPPVLLVKGQKNTGKSTFARSLANRLCSRHRRVAFLECDLGQSEFTPGGMVALNVIEQPVFGPPFTHPTLPYQAHYLGAHNPRSSPSRYLHAIQALVEVYRLDLQFATPFVDIEEGDNRIANSIPLVVNTMGWTKGLGIDLARRLEEFVQPSDIFSFDISPSDSGSELGGPRLHTIEPFSPAQQFTPSDHRALSILSYFHATFPKPIHSAPHQQIIASRWSTDLPLCARPPYELTSHLALDRIVLTGAGAEDVVCSELKRVLAGALVALVSGPPPPEGNEGLYTPGSPPPDPASSNCLGLALVRGVSSDGSKLQLLTPVPSEILANARVLVMGELQLPVWGWLDFRDVEGGACAGMDVPFLRWGRGAGAGSERRRIRRNIMRRGQM